MRMPCRNVSQKIKSNDLYVSHNCMLLSFFYRSMQNNAAEALRKANKSSMSCKEEEEEEEAAWQRKEEESADQQSSENGLNPETPRVRQTGILRIEIIISNRHFLSSPFINI